MKKFSANYCNSNSNFIITNLPEKQVETPYTNIIRIVQNIIMRGTPTIASAYLRKELNLERDYLDKGKYKEQVKFLSKENLIWTQTIKGDVSNDDYPANQFYDDLEHVLNRAGFIRNLTIAECPISQIIPEVTKVFIKQDVDFYIPLLNTIIEVDGSQHDEQKTLDNMRDKAFERFGVKVIRINTKEIRSRNYKQFLNEFREIYKTHKSEIEKYGISLDMDRKLYDVQIKLTSIVRLQVLILELLDRGILSFDNKCWDFNVATVDAKVCLELALKDLELWVENISALFNVHINMPNVNIKVFENETLLPRHQNEINIALDIFKRWDDSIKEQNVYHIRTDFWDNADYFTVKVNEPIVYCLKPETHQKQLEFLLENLFGYKKFNPGQIDIIINCLNGEDTIGLLPTGGGKSLTYQLCIMLQPAISFVVVPIKSLMLDQVNNLISKHKITHASYINSNLPANESTQRLRQFSAGKYLFLIISPERFQSANFREELSLVNRTKALSIAVIDEVHCLSEWGHQFRTSYLVLANAIRKIAPSARFLALTATASSKVLQDIMNELEVESHNVKTISDFKRSNLNFNIIPVNKAKKKEKLYEILTKTHSISSGSPKKNIGLIFTSTVNGYNGCYDLYGDIYSATGLTTEFYSGEPPKAWPMDHPNSFPKYKDYVQESFMHDQIDVLVATKAFGMGIDKDNVRQTIHYGIPNSLESFYQEAGRAGRDGEPSDCMVLYSPDQLNEEKMQSIFGMTTDLDFLKTEMKKMGGDLSTLLFFLLIGLQDIETEVEDIYNFYQSVSQDGNNTVVVSWHSDKDHEVKEKSVYRLALLGIVEDWTIKWKSRQIEIVFNNWTEQEVIDCLTNHIQKYDYTFTLIRTDHNLKQDNDLADFFNNSDKPFLKRILYVLLKWYNDNVIYQRKRSILIMKQYADEFTDSENLQEKIETYFKRNDDVYFLESTVANRARLKDWYKIFYVQAEGKPDIPRATSTFQSLKITVSRFLESYQNDIALNLINGIISLSEGNFESIDGRERMSLAIQKIITFEPDERQEMLQSILETADQFFTVDQGGQLSEVLISNGFVEMNELRQIYCTIEDEYSYGYMLNTLNSKIKEQSAGGYPWEI